MSTEGEAAVADLNNSATNTADSLTNAVQVLSQKIEQERQRLANLPLPPAAINQATVRLDDTRQKAEASANGAKSELTNLSQILPKLAGAWEISATAAQARTLATSAREYATSVKPQNLASTNTWESASAREFRTSAGEHATAADNAATDAENLASKLESLSDKATADTATLIADLAKKVNEMAEQAGPLSEIGSAPGASSALNTAKDGLSSTRESGVVQLESTAETASRELAAL